MKNLTSEQVLARLERARFATDDLQRRLNEIVARSTRSQDTRAEVMADLASIADAVTELARRILDGDPAPHLRSVKPPKDP